MIIKKSAATQRRQQVENILRPLQHLINERCVPKKKFDSTFNVPPNALGITQRRKVGWD